MVLFVSLKSGLVSWSLGHRVQFFGDGVRYQLEKVVLVLFGDGGSVFDFGSAGVFGFNGVFWEYEKFQTIGASRWSFQYSFSRFVGLSWCLNSGGSIAGLL